MQTSKLYIVSAYHIHDIIFSGTWTKTLRKNKKHNESCKINNIVLLHGWKVRITILIECTNTIDSFCKTFWYLLNNPLTPPFFLLYGLILVPSFPRCLDFYHFSPGTFPIISITVIIVFLVFKPLIMLPLFQFALFLGRWTFGFA